MKSVKSQSLFMKKLKRAGRSEGFRRLFPVLIVGCILLAVLLVSCARSGSRAVRKSVALELDPLKKLDSDTVSSYISSDTIFPDGTEEQPPSDEITEVFTMYFKDFDYKIKSVRIDSRTGTAEANVTIKTPDSYKLATDFMSAMIETLIMKQADDPASASGNLSLDERFLILNRLLSDQSYDVVGTDCVIELTRKDGQWIVEQNSSLKNAVVGGLMAHLSDPGLLSPKDTLQVYLSTLEKMNIEQMGNYLGLHSLLHSENTDNNTIVLTILEQLHQNFDFSIGEESINGYKAAVNAVITAIDSEAVASAYLAASDEYKKTPDWVIDGDNGAEKRIGKLRELFLEQIQNDSNIGDSEIVFNLINDGISWKLEDPGTSLSTVLFGNLFETFDLSESSENSDVSNEGSAEDTSSQEDFSDDSE